jgi:protein TonB
VDGIIAQWGKGDYRSSGWLVSLTLHCGALALAIQSAPDLRLTEKPDKFQWDVVLATAPSSVAQPTVPASISEPTTPPPPAPPPRTARPSVQAGPQSMTRQVVERRPVLRNVQPIQRETAPPVPMTREATTQAPQHIESSVVESRDVVQQAVQQESIVTEPVEQTMAVQSRALARDQPTTMQQEPQTNVMTQEVRQVEPTEVQTIASEPIVRASLTQENSASVVENQTVHHKEPAVTAVEAQSQPQPLAQASAAAVVQRPSVKARPSAQADFGWLAESLWRRIEDLKRYPSLARSRRWEGRVVVEAVIRHDGEILDCQIAESSGHGVLDQDALAVLRRASPLPLKHPLGRDQVTILLPITYRLHS